MSSSAAHTHESYSAAHTHESCASTYIHESFYVDDTDDKKYKYVAYFTASNDPTSLPLIHGVFQSQLPTPSRMQVDEAVSATEAKLLKTPASLLLALQHPKKTVRLAALHQYQIYVKTSSNNGNDDGTDYTSLSHMAALCMNDTNSEVRSAALKSDVILRLCTYCSHEEMEEQGDEPLCDESHELLHAVRAVEGIASSGDGAILRK